MALLADLGAVVPNCRSGYMKIDIQQRVVTGRKCAKQNPSTTPGGWSARRC